MASIGSAEIACRRRYGAVEASDEWEDQSPGRHATEVYALISALLQISSEGFDSAFDAGSRRCRGPCSRTGRGVTFGKSRFRLRSFPSVLECLRHRPTFRTGWSAAGNCEECGTRYAHTDSVWSPPSFQKSDDFRGNRTVTRRKVPIGVLSRPEIVHR